MANVSVGLISLGGGLPSSQYFPFEHIDIKVPSPPHFSEQETRETGIVKRVGKRDQAEGKCIYGMSTVDYANQLPRTENLSRFSQTFT